jgi:hypothetical protein
VGFLGWGIVRRAHIRTVPIVYALNFDSIRIGVEIFGGGVCSVVVKIVDDE